MAQAIAFLGAGGLEFAFLRDLHAARTFLGDQSAVPIMENSPLTPPPDSTAHRQLWPLFISGTDTEPAPVTRGRLRQPRDSRRAAAPTTTRTRPRNRSARAQRRLDSDDDSASVFGSDADGDDADGAGADSATKQDGF